MAKLTEEQFNAIIQQDRPLGLVKLDDIFTDDLGLERYDVIGDGDYEGHTIKNFYRVDSAIFKSAFDEIKNNPDCSFVTIYNDIVKEGIIPEKVSVLIKDTRDYVEERVASQLLNFYGVACPVNICSVGDDLFKDEEHLKESRKRSAWFRDALAERSGYYTYVVSIDFMAEGRSLETICSYEDKLQFFQDLEGSVDCFREKMSELSNAKKFGNISTKKHKELSELLEDQFVMSMLVRRLIFHDIDFNSNNVGVFLGGNPCVMNFDFELCFGSPIEKESSLKLIKDAIRFYPHVWAEFALKSQELYSNILNAGKKETRKVFKKAQIMDVLIENLSFIDECLQHNFSEKILL